MEGDTSVTLPDESSLKKVLFSGIHGETASETAKCVVTINNIILEGNASECIQQSSELSNYFGSDFHGFFQIGESDTHVGRSFERCLQTMLPDEVSLMVLSIKSQTDTGKLCDSIIGSIRCQVKLHQVIHQGFIFDLDEDGKYQTAMRNKMCGVDLFKAGRIVDAFLRFSKALKYLITIDYVDNNLGTTQAQHVTDLRVVLYNNLASCQLKCSNFGYAVELCGKVLALQPGNVKALFRRGVANVELREYDAARDDFKSVLSIEPSNKAAADKLREVNEKTVEIHNNYANVVKKMFEL